MDITHVPARRRVNRECNPYLRERDAPMAPPDLLAPHRERALFALEYGYMVALS